MTQIPKGSCKWDWERVMPMKIKSPKAKSAEVQVPKKRPTSDTGKKHPITILAVEASDNYKKLVIGELIKIRKVQIVKGKGKGEK